jgi:hypothetical protein
MPKRATKTDKKSKIGGKRYAMNMRTTSEVRRKLEDAAAESGRSLAQEIEFPMKPPGDPTPPTPPSVVAIGDPLPTGVDLFANVGRGVANTILEEAATGHTRTTGTVQRARRLHRAVGPLVAERLSGFTTPEFRDAESHIGDDQ